MAGRKSAKCAAQVNGSLGQSSRGSLRSDKKDNTTALTGAGAGTSGSSEYHNRTDSDATDSNAPGGRNAEETDSTMIMGRHGSRKIRSAPPGDPAGQSSASGGGGVLSLHDDEFDLEIESISGDEYEAASATGSGGHGIVGGDGETKRSLRARLQEALRKREELRQLIGRLATERDQYYDRSRVAEDELEAAKNDLETYQKIVTIFREKRKEYIVFKRGVAVALGSVRSRVQDAIQALTDSDKGLDEKNSCALRILDQLAQTVKNIDDRSLEFDPMSPSIE